MESELILKIKKLLKDNIISVISILIAIASIVFGIYYANSKECPKCEVCPKNIESESYESKVQDEFYKVDVKGAVVNPKVYTLESGATVEDAINAAGGIARNGTTENINLSKKLTDEMVVYVFTKDEIAKEKSDNEIVCDVPKCECEKIEVNSGINKNATSKQTQNNGINNSQTAKPVGKISINTGSLDDLMTLNGIGETKAKAIIDYRNTNGNFKDIQDIKNVKGIGDAAYEKIKDYITT